MVRTDPFVVAAGLLILVLLAALHELRDGTIPNAIVLVGTLAFLLLGHLVSGLPVSSHLLGALLMFTLFGVVGMGVIPAEWCWGREVIGAGAVKLLILVGAALGLREALIVGAAFIAAAIIFLKLGEHLLGMSSIPSAPIVLSILSVWAAARFHQTAVATQDDGEDSQASEPVPPGSSGGDTHSTPTHLH